MRMRRKPSYLIDYILSIDFRRYRIKKNNIIVPKPLKIFPSNSPDYDELKGFMIHLIRLKMNHSVQRYFSLNLGLATTGYLNFLFNKFSHRKSTRTMKMRINSLKYYVNTQTWGFLVASDFIDHDGHIKIYKNSSNEFIKTELCWLRFKYNEHSKILSCSGKFTAFIKKDERWKLI